MSEKTEISVEAKIVRHPGRVPQTFIYLGKLFRLFVYQSDWIVLPMSALIAGLVSFAVGSGIFRTMEATLMGAFAVSCICIWNGFFNSIQVICRERAIVKREHRAGLHISSYVAAHMIYQAILSAAQSVITIIIFLGTKVTFPEKSLLTPWPLFDIGITLFLSIYCADMLALLISAITKTTTAAMTIMPFLLMVQLVFAGVLFELPKEVGFLQNLTVSKWSLTALCTQGDYNDLPMVSVWNTLVGMDELEIEGQKPLKEVLIYIQENDMRDDVLKKSGEMNQVADYEYSLKNLCRCWLWLLLWTAVYAAIAIIALEFVDKDKR